MSSATQRAVDAAGLAANQFPGIGFFFCGIRLLPVEYSSGSSMKPNSGEANRTKSSDRRERCIASVESAKRYSSAKSRSLTASRLLAVMREKPRSRASALRSSGNAQPARAPEPSGQASARGRGRGEAFRIALIRFTMREQPMRKQQRLGVLHVRGSGHGHAEIAFGLCGDARDRAERRAARISRAASLTYMRNSVATISLRLRPVCSLAPSGPSFSISAVSAK